MRKELLEIAAQAVAAAKAAGAQDAFASANRSRDVEFSLRNGKLEKVQDATSKGLSLKLYVDGRYSAHSTTDLRPEQVKAFVANGVAITRALQADPHRKLAPKELYPTKDIALDLQDSKVGKLDRDQHIT